MGDRQYNRNKYNPKRLATAGMRVLSNGSIQTNNWVTPAPKKVNKSKRPITKKGGITAVEAVERR